MPHMDHIKPAIRALSALVGVLKKCINVFERIVKVQTCTLQICIHLSWLFPTSPTHAHIHPVPKVCNATAIVRVLQQDERLSSVRGVH